MTILHSTRGFAPQTWKWSRLEDTKYRYRPKGVFGKGVGNSENASEMRQKCVKNASKMRLVLLGKEERSKMRQNCVNNAQNTFGGEHLLDDTENNLLPIRVVETVLWENGAIPC